MNFLLEFIRGFIGTLNAELLSRAEPFLKDEAAAFVKVGERTIEILFNTELTAEEKSDAWDGWKTHFELFAEACKREGSVIASEIGSVLFVSITNNIANKLSGK